MSINYHNIAELVETQFPEFYLQSGDEFIQFVKAYYEWEDSISKSRDIQDLYDVSSAGKFISHFIETYLQNIPETVIKDKELLTKHCLDLYRSKGNPENIKLLFRILFQEEIDILNPSKFIFKLDNDKWFKPTYIEIEAKHTNIQFESKIITGLKSAAQAIVEKVETIYSTRNRQLFYISNIKGEFIPGEKISAPGISESLYPIILGSLTSVYVTGSDVNFNIGDIIVGNNETVGYVTNTAFLQGIAQFNIIDGGWGYSLENSIIDIIPLPGVSGSGAAIKISELTNKKDILSSNVAIRPYANVPLNAITYAYDHLLDTSNMASSNISTSIQQAVYGLFTYGTISKIDILNPGSNYDGGLSVHVYDPTYLSGHDSANTITGTYDGNNAIISGFGAYGRGAVTELKIETSGYFYGNNELIILYDQANTLHKITGYTRTSGVGLGTGYWKTSTSKLDNYSKLRDDYFYQEFSYSIKTEQRLNKYFEILQNISHPAGTKQFQTLRLHIE